MITGTVYRVARSAWRTLIPKSFNDAFFNGRTPFSKAVLGIKSRLERSVGHDDIYSRDYYEGYAAEMAQSAIGMTDSVMKLLSPSSAIDIGCGDGAVLARFSSLGVETHGMDYSQAAVAICREKDLDVIRFDLESADPLPSWIADTVISTEVAEHLPASCADKYVDTLCKFARKSIVITAAPPGQGGTDHVNEQPKEYWIEKFSLAGANYSPEFTEHMREAWRASGVERSRMRNVLVFLKP